MSHLMITEQCGNHAPEAKVLLRDAKNFLKLTQIESLRVLHVFNIANVTDEAMMRIREQIFSEPILNVYDTMPTFKDKYIHVRYREGQYDALQDQVLYMAQKMLGMEGVDVTHSIIYATEGLTQEAFDTLTNYLINPTELERVGPQRNLENTDISDLEPILNFITMDEEALRVLGKDFAMDFEDLKYTQQYFKTEGRNPNRTELKVIDTYWSDHCRHTTFLTHLDEVLFEGKYQDLVKASWTSYLETRKDLNVTKPITLMNIATINAKEIRAKGLLADLDESEEVNAASIHVDVEGEDTLLLFKNETHNHPTEIEPYGGASTCIGGGVRDPLSGRGYVYQAMRITGARSPLLPFDKTYPGKLSQRHICQRAAEGYANYLNQMGIDGGYLKEYYHDGFEAKRMELGALVAAVPSDIVQKSIPSVGDHIIMLGAKTGRDGLGAAVGSSKTTDDVSLDTVGAEVQKGNPMIERKIVRLFRNADAVKMIKRCNDMGAGGVSVAVGELADSLEINLDKVPLKYQGLHGGEIALSESQERMVVVLAEKDVEAFTSIAAREDLVCHDIAVVTDSGYMEMKHKGETIIKISRDFLSSNGTDKTTDAIVVSDVVAQHVDPLNLASQQGLIEQFNNQDLNRPRITPELGMAARIPVSTGLSKVSSLMTHGYNPFISGSSPYHAGYIATVDAITKVVAMGGTLEGIRLSYQEYFESLGRDARRWGKPLAALLGAFTVMKALDIPALGGKDSMSGSYGDLSVPPSLLCFAVQTTPTSHVISRALKPKSSELILIDSGYSHDTLLDLEVYRKNMNTISRLNQAGKVLAASTVTTSLSHEIFEMSLEHKLAIPTIDEGTMMPGAIILQVSTLDDVKDFEYIHLGHISGVKGVDVERLEAWQKPLEDVYHPNKWHNVTHTYELIKRQPKSPQKQPSMLVPVLTGMTGDIDLELRLQKHNIDAAFEVINYTNYEASIEQFIEKLSHVNILFLLDGSKMIHDVFNTGVMTEVFLRHPRVSEALELFITRKGIVVGSGAGFVSLINVGYFGDDVVVKPNEKRTFTHRVMDGVVINPNNPLAHHVGDRVRVSLNSAMIRVEANTHEHVFMIGSESLDNEPMILGMHAHEGSVLGTVSQIENNEPLIESFVQYFVEEA